MNNRKLVLGFHGRIIDHLGIQMYQSPTAAIAEIVSNAWDADAEKVDISFSFEGDSKSDWKISVSDDGDGMTLEECQHRFLSVGYNRRAAAGPAEVTGRKSRPVMGRKGIGKFAGFGVARFIRIATCSRRTKEYTEFELDLLAIRQGDSYVSTKTLHIDVLSHELNSSRPHGTKITLRDLKIGRRIPEAQFRQSLARRFVINSTADEFEVRVSGTPIEMAASLSNVEMSFPEAFSEAELAERGTLVDQGGWGEECLSDGKKVRWRVMFMRDLVKDPELQGITVFSHKKLAQRPFMFNLSGGLASQAGPEYMSGQVTAEWVDELGDDVISTERQRLNWDHPDLEELQAWGQALIRRLLSVWKEQRTRMKMDALSAKVSAFSDRIAKLGSEGQTVRKALRKLAQLEKLNQEQFIDMGNAILLAWEGGRLRELISHIAGMEALDEAGLVEILTEANAITALHTAETVKAKLAAIQGLEQRVKKRDLENAVRDYIAKNPWLISPKWETFAKESRVTKLCADAARGTLDGDDYRGRVDLVMSSGHQLLVLEFMRPGISLDRDHLDRFNRYLDIIQEGLEARTGLEFSHLSGYLVADKLERQLGTQTALRKMKEQERFALDWAALIAQSKHQWREFLEHVKSRAPEDNRLAQVTAPYSVEA